MTEEKEEYLKIGEYVPADEERGTPRKIRRDYYRQGWIFKDEEAYLDEKHPDRICYIPELSDGYDARGWFYFMPGLLGEREEIVWKIRII